MMSTWRIHVCNARGRLDSRLETIRYALTEAETACLDVHPPVALDLVVRATDAAMPSELEMSGASYGPGRIDMGIDVSGSLDRNGMTKAIPRTAYHEFHHVLRWDGPGYGRTPGEALVSEGLAQVFVHEMVKCPPEPWETAIAAGRLAEICRHARSGFETAGYNHAEWFFGRGRFPNWSGYTVGKVMVDRFLAAHAGASALDLATEQASRFRPFLCEL